MGGRKIEKEGFFYALGGGEGGGRVKDEALSGCHGLSLGLFPLPLSPSSAFSGFNHPLASSTEAMAIRVILASPRRVALPIFVIEPPGPSTFHYVYFFSHARSPRFSTRFRAVQVLVSPVPAEPSSSSRRHFPFRNKLNGNNRVCA